MKRLNRARHRRAERANMESIVREESTASRVTYRISGVSRKLQSRIDVERQEESRLQHLIMIARTRRTKVVKRKAKTGSKETIWISLQLVPSSVTPEGDSLRHTLAVATSKGLSLESSRSVPALL